MIEADWDRRYSLEDFTALLSASQTKSEGSSTLDIDALAVSARIKNLIRGINVRLRVESPEPVSDDYQTSWPAVTWEKLLQPRNLWQLNY